MTPTLPTLARNDPDPKRREEVLLRMRRRYRYDYRYQNLCFVDRVPWSDQIGWEYLCQALGATLQLAGNRLRYVLKRGRLGRTFEKLDSTDDFHAMFQSLVPPPVSRSWKEDWVFAWQRIAGAVPTLITGIERLPDHFPVTQNHFARAMGEGERLEAALAERRLFLCDYRVFDGVPCGRYPPTSRRGLQKYVAAPLALFCATPRAPGGLLPVAIQCEQRPGPQNPIYTPADGERWTLAKYLVQVADANLEGIIVHFGYTHMILQRFILAAHRCMSPDHPLWRLFRSHFEYTLAANQFARGRLVVVNGVQDRILSPTLPATESILRASEREVELADLDPTLDAARHGVLNRDLLPMHPFRDDGIEVWHATRRWVEQYVSLYYSTDADAAGDLELRAMLDEVGSADGGQLPRLVAGVATNTRAAVVDLVARIIHRASTYHAAINYNWWDWMGFVPNAPSVCVAPMPGPEENVDASTLLRMLPPFGVVWETFQQIYPVHNVRGSRLGEYPEGFTDPRVALHLADFRRELNEVENRIAERNRERPMPYDCLKPSLVTASINS